MKQFVFILLSLLSIKAFSATLEASLETFRFDRASQFSVLKIKSGRLSINEEARRATLTVFYEAPCPRGFVCSQSEAQIQFSAPFAIGAASHCDVTHYSAKPQREEPGKERFELRINDASHYSCFGRQGIVPLTDIVLIERGTNDLRGGLPFEHKHYFSAGRLQ